MADIVKNLMLRAVQMLAVPSAELPDVAVDESERMRLTDEERAAISLAYSRLTADAKYGEVAATLKALLERVRK